MAATAAGKVLATNAGCDIGHIIASPEITGLHQ
jgi:hypothetical protein